MPNNLYQQLNGNNSGNIIQRFNEFRNSFQGDPQQTVLQLLQSGRMSQAQYNQLRQMAQQFSNLLRRG